MWYLVFKYVLSAALVVLVSEVSKRSGLLGGLLASLPLVSFLAMIWLYVDTRDVQKVADLSWSILWLVIPSLSLFIALPLLIKKLPFVASLAIATLIMFVCYGAMTIILRRFGAAA